MIDTKLLRQKILDLAIRGKLVPQNPNDEPASVLLDKIRKEKTALVKAGKIKKDKHESFIFRGDDKHYYEQVDGKTSDITILIPFDLPDNWQWVRLRDIGEIVGGGTPSTTVNAYWENGNIAWLSPADLTGYSQMFISHGKKDITGLGLQNSSAVVMPAGSLLYSSRAPIGYIVIAAGEIATNQGFKSLVPTIVEISEFYYYALKAVTPDIKKRATGTTFKEISGAEFGATLVPLPPLAEQQRIVAQIEMLMAEVDKIDQEAQELDKALTLAKQKVLDLAIRGKLVPQDPKDEPASELLKRIKAEKEALIKAGKIKRDKHESFIFRGDDNRYYEQFDGKTVDITENVPFEIPSSWEWTRLSSLCDYGSCQSVEPNAIPESAWVVDLEDIEKESGRLLVRVKKNERPPTSSKHRFFADNVLYSKLRTYLNKVLVADQDGFCTSEILPLNFGNHLVPEFARIVLMSPMFLAYTIQCGYGVKMPRLGTEDGRKAFIPVPPLSEQKRIVLQVKKIQTALTKPQDLE